MKKITLIIILLLSNILFSQGNANYLDSTSEWRSFRGGWGESIYSTLYFDGFGSFNGNIYYKTYRNDHKIATNIYVGGTTITNELYGPSYIRESNGIFLIYNVIDNSESIWFNNQALINSQIGDTFSFQNTNCTIEAITSNSLGSVQLKRITGANTQGYTGAIEGIGEIGGVCSAGIEYTSYLTCYTKQSNTIQFGNLDCNLFPSPVRVNLSTTSNSSFVNMLNVFPNPTNGILKVNLSPKLVNENYKIYDIRGVLIKEGIFKNVEQTIDITNYLNGIYILKIESENSTEYTKIIKE